MCDGSDHDHGLQHDLNMLLERRHMLKLVTSAGAVGLLAGCDWGPSLSRAQGEQVASATDGTQCVAHTTETAGPFPADGSNRAHGTLANVLADSGVVRKDIRSNLGKEGELAPGERLEFSMRLVNVNDACTPLKDHAVYLWHCDADGNYSIYNLPDHSYLRGVGVSDAEGRVHFTTIVPGCYRGRYPHMHFEVYPSLAKATDYKNRILTSQLAIPETTCKAVYGAHPAYAASVENFKATPPLERDGIFRDNTPKQLEAQTITMGTASTPVYTGEVVVGLAV